jgi:hypothetical protein
MTITFRVGFDKLGIYPYQYPNTVSNFRDPQPYEKIPTRLTLVDNPIGGSKVFRAEIRPGDNLGSSGERAEIYSMFGADGIHIVENEASGIQFHALRVYLPLDFTSPKEWGIFTQLHGSDTYSAPPVFALGAMSDFYVQMWSGELGDANYMKPDKLHRTRYTLAPVIRGKWVDFVWKIKYAKTYTGTLDVWMRTDGTFKNVLSIANIPTLQFAPGGPILDAYWKTGYYSSVENFTRIVYLDSHTRGDNYNEVIAAAFPVRKIQVKIVNRGFLKNLNIRPDPTMYNTTLGYFLPDMIIPLQEIVTNSEGVWGKVTDGLWIALYLNSNGKTYAMRI